MRKACMKKLCDLAESDNSILLLTGDVVQDMNEFQEKFPDRFYNIGLCEQSMVAMAGGLASQGFIPVVYSITPFLLERCFEFIKIDIDANKLPVILIGYSDYPHHGTSHTCLNQESMVKILPNTRSFFPQNPAQAIMSLKIAWRSESPAFIFLKK